MGLINKEQWIIVSKDRKAVAVGVPRNRFLEPIDKTTKRILTYKSKKLAESGFKTSFFYQWDLKKRYEEEDLEAVKVNVIYEEVND